MGLEEKLSKDGFVTSKIDDLIKWSRKNALWPMPMGISCCAIEMMAAAILIYPHSTEEDVRFKKGIVTALKDEQKHLSLYIKRMNELGYEFGDFPLNDFFWRQLEKV